MLNKYEFIRGVSEQECKRRLEWLREKQFKDIRLQREVLDKLWHWFIEDYVGEIPDGLIAATAALKKIPIATFDKQIVAIRDLYYVEDFTSVC